MIEKTKPLLAQIKRSFNRASTTYNTACAIQLAAGQTLIKLLTETLHQPGDTINNIIDLGCGTGLVTEKLAQTFGYHQFHAIDIADKLLEQANNRLQKYHISTHYADFNDYSPHIRFNLVFSNLALQWSPDLSQSIHVNYAKLAHKGIFAFSLPLAGSLAALISCNTFPTQHDITQLLRANRFQMIYSTIHEQTSFFNSPLSALKSIRAVGANLLFKKNHFSLRGKSFLDHLIRNIPCQEEGYFLRYNTGYFIAQKSGHSICP